MSATLPTEAAPSFSHLLALTDETGLFEHARLDVPRREHGYCVDDVARALIVAAREPVPSAELRRATQTYLDFVDEAVGNDGRVNNRRNVQGRWTDEPALGDWWGRAVWACGIAATTLTRPHDRERARSIALRALQQDSPFVRANVFAAIGAAELLLAAPEDRTVRRFLHRALERIPREPSKDWTWPQNRLQYSNGSYVEAIVVAAHALDDERMLARGLELLTFLLDRETDGNHLSVTGVGGSDPFSARPQFDQQPIEVAAIADACARAWAVTGDSRWREALALTWEWFLGNNDSGVPLYDPATGAGFDGLERNGRNENRGAESTLAAVSTRQHVLTLRAPAPLRWLPREKKSPALAGERL